jgi:arylsulfatase A-like enzyme
VIQNRVRHVAIGVCVLLGAGALAYRMLLVPRAAPNVLFILVDTLRADRLGEYGHVRRLAPFLEGYGGRSLVFDRAYSASSWTLPAVMSLFVGQRPFEHGLVDFYVRLPEERITIAEVLAAHDYETAAFLATTALPAELGYGQGFGVYRVVGNPHAKAEEAIDATEVNKAALEWLDGRRSRRPFFLYLHYMEPHWPYVPHPGVTAPRADLPRPSSPFFLHARHVGDVADERIGRRAARGNSIADPVERDRNWDFSTEEIARLRDLYDGEVKYLDGRLAELFAELERRGTLANSIVVVTADHGEELGEHGLFGHGAALYDAEIHVPLLVHLPGHGPTGHVVTPVETAGLASALLRAAGIDPAPSFRVPPVPLGGETNHGRAAPVSQLAKIGTVALWLHRTAVLDGERKLLVASDGTPSVRDLHADPEELHPLDATAAEAARAAALDRCAWLEAARPSPAAVVNPPALARLRALGYVDPGAP